MAVVVPNAKEMLGVVPPEEITGYVAVTAVTLPAPQAEPVVVSIPPRPACTQLPFVRLDTERSVVEAYVMVPFVA